MKKLFNLTAATLAVLLLCGCSSYGYKLAHENGTYHIQFSNAPSSEASGNTSSSVERIGGVFFASFEEMQQDFKTGNFSEEEMERLRAVADENGKIAINFDLDTPLEAVFPASFGLELKHIGFDRGEYGLTYRASDLPAESESEFAAEAIHCSVSILSKENYDYQYERRITDLIYRLQNPNWYIKVHSVTNDLERNATVYSYTTGQEADAIDVELAVYTIHSDNKTLHIVETEASNGPENLHEYSTRIPNTRSFTILGEESGKYFMIFLSNWPVRPTIEELSSIGIREYT